MEIACVQSPPSPAGLNSTIRHVKFYASRFTPRGGLWSSRISSVAKDARY